MRPRAFGDAAQLVIGQLAAAQLVVQHVVIAKRKKSAA